MIVIVLLCILVIIALVVYLVMNRTVTPPLFTYGLSQNIPSRGYYIDQSKGEVYLNGKLVKQVWKEVGFDESVYCPLIASPTIYDVIYLASVILRLDVPLIDTIEAQTTPWVKNMFTIINTVGDTNCDVNLKPREEDNDIGAEIVSAIQQVLDLLNSVGTDAANDIALVIQSLFGAILGSQGGSQLIEALNQLNLVENLANECNLRTRVVFGLISLPSASKPYYDLTFTRYLSNGEKRIVRQRLD